MSASRSRAQDHLPSADALRHDLLATLLAARNADGGWPYYAKKASRLEPTAWALMALAAAGQPVSPAALASWPRRDGWWLDKSSDTVNVAFNAIVALALAVLGARGELTSELLRLLVGFKGEAQPTGQNDRQDNSIQGWSWVAGTFSWVEPTAWGLLALKKLVKDAPGDEARARIVEGERLLVNRACVDGGWNAGNAWALERPLVGHVPTTALGLLALGDRADGAVARRALSFLELHRVSEPAAISLGLTRVALACYSRPVKDVDEALVAQWHRTGYIGNLHAAAVALYALSAGPPYAAFRLG